MNAVATTTEQTLMPASQNTQPGFGNLQSFELMQRAAKLLSNSTLVPKEYQGNLPNCVIALNMAARVGADPLQVMQNLYVVHGRPGWSSQFLIATFNQCGRFTAMRFEFFGEAGKDTYGCRAYATEKSTGERIVGSDITIAIAKAEGWHGKNGSKWKTMPQQMLMYRSASFLVRAYAPELSMGLQTRDELDDIDEVPTVTVASRDPSVIAALEHELTGGASAAIDTTGEPVGITAQDVHDALAGAETAEALDEAWDLSRELSPEAQAPLIELYQQRALDLKA